MPQKTFYFIGLGGKAMRLSLQSTNRDLQMFRARARSAKFRQSAFNQGIGSLGGLRLFRPVTHGFSRSALVFHLVQLSFGRCHLIQTGGNHQHGYAIRIGLPHRRHDVAQTWPSDDISYPRLA